SLTVYELYWRAISGDTIAVSDGSGSTTNSSYHEYIFFAGRRVARSDPSSGNVYYFFVDQVGSTRAMTDQSGSVCFQMDYFPYGQENTPAGVNNTCSTSYLFTGYERDAETGLDYAFARYYNSREARFMSADPLAGDIADPQSLNRYAYVMNNPTSYIDPSGLDTSSSDCSTTASCTVWVNGDASGIGPGVYVTYNCFLTIGSVGCAPVRHVNQVVKNLPPPPKPQSQSYADCVKNLANVDSIQNLTHAGNGFLASSFLSNTFSSFIQLSQDISAFPFGSTGNDIAQAALSNGLGPLAQNAAQNVPNVAVSAAAVSITASENGIQATATSVTAILPFGTLAQAGAGLLADVFTGKIIYDAGIALGASAVCAVPGIR
ncbi:MAG TPA: RHS repeat-associated core domain-containing protein, partial [Candidatus Dormibacteraeota bacterium]|nr:RHS repeat-associated core domain-containing protein [Candidatus Dormibacteraeota bacterium]